MVRKNFSRDREKLLEFEAEGREFAKFLRLVEQFIQTVKGQNNFSNRGFFNLFSEVSEMQVYLIRTVRIQIGKKILGFRNMQEKLENSVFHNGTTQL
mgnify:CR=1 FL=1